MSKESELAKELVKAIFKQSIFTRLDLYYIINKTLKDYARDTDHKRHGGYS